MKLSFSTKGWHNNTFEEFCEKSDFAQDIKDKYCAMGHILC